MTKMSAAQRLGVPKMFAAATLKLGREAACSARVRPTPNLCFEGPEPEDAVLAPPWGGGALYPLEAEAAPGAAKLAGPRETCSATAAVESCVFEADRAPAKAASIPATAADFAPTLPTAIRAPPPAAVCWVA